jgi:hypothetical protein
MVIKSKKSVVRKAARLAPMFASLTALAMVAACARTNGNKTAISPEKQEKAATVISARLFKDYDQNQPLNLEFASHFKGASVVINGRDKNNVQATIKMMFDDHDPVIVTKLLPLGKSENAVVLMDNVDKTAKTDITVQAGCGSVECAVISAKMTLKKEIDDTMAAPVAAPAPDAAPAAAPAPVVSDDAHAGAALKVASASVPAVSDVATLPVSATPETPAVPAKKVITAENVLGFVITDGAAATGETEAQTTARLSKMILKISGRTAAGDGAVASYEDAYKAVKGEAPPADAPVTVLTDAPAPAAGAPAATAPGAAAPAATGTAAPAPGPDVSADANTPAAAPAVAPAPAPAAAAPVVAPAPAPVVAPVAAAPVIAPAPAVAPAVAPVTRATTPPAAAKPVKTTTTTTAAAQPAKPKAATPKKTTKPKKPASTK